MTLIERIFARAAASPEALAICFEGQALSYGELARRAIELSAHLSHDCGVSPGDRVGLWFENSPDFVTAYLATLRAGGVAVSISPALKGPEVEYLVGDCRPRVILTTAQRQSGAVARSLPCPVLDSAAAGPLVGPAPPPAPRQSTDPAAILYTSGTTGRPKGVVLTHGNLSTNTAAVEACVGAGPGDRHLLFLPLFHCFGQNFIQNTALATGGTIVLLRRFDADDVLAAAASAGVTHFYAVPTVYALLLEHSEAVAQLARVRYFFSAAAPMPVEVALRFRAHFGRVIHEGYGLTETSPLATYNHLRSYRIGSVGVPISQVELEVKDERGRRLGTMEPGEIWIRGPNVMAGYFERDEETRAVLVDGWLRTGDVGYRDPDGYYFLVDRIKDMINRAGFKIWPSEVEEVLSQHPGVKECAVVGVPDERLGERVCAYVTPHEGLRLTEEQLDEHCRALLANYKLPEAYVLGAVIPRNPAGKILRRLLRSDTPHADGVKEER